MSDDVIALLELEVIEGAIRLAAERHYRLVSPEEVTPGDLAIYRERPFA